MQYRSQEFTEIQEIMVNEFAHLNPEQLSFTLSAASWSIGQCLHHLIVTNKTYFPVFDKIINGKYRPGFWARNNPFSARTGQAMIKSLGPDTSKKYKSPRIFQPNSKNIPFNIVELFVKHQQELIEKTEKLENLSPEAIIIPSPASPLITYPLSDCLDLLLAHEQRHLKQARSIFQHEKFPG